MGIRFKSLGSGSAGNATVIQANQGTQRANVLVDCGFSARQMQQRLAHAGLQWADITALFITHEHADHIGCAFDAACRHQLPIWMSQGTWLASGQPNLHGLLHTAQDAIPIDIAGVLQLTPFTVPHDAREPLHLTCTDGNRKLGIVTDLGHASPHVIHMLQTCHALLLECNHDPELLAASHYPAFLKNRIASPYGHLSNAASAQLAQQLNHSGLHHVAAAHLSERNNRPELAREALSQALNRKPHDLWILDATTGGEWLTV